MARKIIAVQESDLRMKGNLAMSIQRVMPVTQADIDAAALNGEHWVVERCVEVAGTIDNTSGPVMRVIKQNSILPGQNVIRVLIENSDTDAVVGPDKSPLSLPNAIADSLQYVKAYGLVEQLVTPSPDSPTGLICNNGGLGIDSYGNIIVSGNQEVIKDSKNNTATCDMLLGLASYKDEQEILTGSIIRRVGIAVLDGTEDWEAKNNWYEADVLPNGDSEYTGILCTHFPFGTPTVANTVHKMYGETKLQINYPAATTVAELKTWLAGQYANGTPVMVVYVLKNPTTDTTSPQTLEVKAGDNTIQITDASLSDLLLEAKYKRSL